jgi:serine/threonine protein kinase
MPGSPNGPPTGFGDISTPASGGTGRPVVLGARNGGLSTPLALTLSSKATMPVRGSAEAVRVQALGGMTAQGADWDSSYGFTSPTGVGISACEQAGYLFGAQEHGVRGKAGTPGFWAPEMLFYENDGKGRRYGPAADYWSFGCLIYALIESRLVANVMNVVWYHCIHFLNAYYTFEIICTFSLNPF